jgi:hypothetical protein
MSGQTDGKVLPLHQAFILCNSYKEYEFVKINICCSNLFLKVCKWCVSPCIFACSEHRLTFKQSTRNDKLWEIFGNFITVFCQQIWRNSVATAISAKFSVVWSNFETQGNLYTVAACSPWRVLDIPFKHFSCCICSKTLKYIQKT